MTAHDVIDQIKALPPEEKTKVVSYVHELEERFLLEETPAMLAAINEGVRSLEEKGGRVFTREELSAKVRQWSGGSR